MKRLVSAFVLFLVSIISRCLFRVKVEWIGEWNGEDRHEKDPWHWVKNHELRVIGFLNHTSLYEPIFAAGIPFHFLWFMAGRLLLPGADKTLKRPIVGTFYKLLTPATVSISRKRDGTWESFLSRISPDTVVILAPEGRMMRRDGLDSKGEPMSVRGGIADILNVIPKGTMVLCYSGGIHHIQAPGERIPRLFKTARMRLEAIDITSYKTQMQQRPEPFKMAVVRDIEARMKQHCPPPE